MSKKEKTVEEDKNDSNTNNKKKPGKSSKGKDNTYNTEDFDKMLINAKTYLKIIEMNERAIQGVMDSEDEETMDITKNKEDEKLEEIKHPNKGKSDGKKIEPEKKSEKEDNEGKKQFDPLDKIYEELKQCGLALSDEKNKKNPREKSHCKLCGRKDRECYNLFCDVFLCERCIYLEKYKKANGMSVSSLLQNDDEIEISDLENIEDLKKNYPVNLKKKLL